MKKQKVNIIINCRDGWEDSIIGIYKDPLKANRRKAEEEQRLKRLKWKDNEIIVIKWQLDD